MRPSRTLKVVILDHYDSYTNNLLQLLHNDAQDSNGESYPEWDVAVIRFDQFSWETFRDSILPDLDAVILSPGPGNPLRESDFGFNSRLIKESNIPILGICLGHQGIGTTFGGKIIHAPNIKHGQVCKIRHTGSGIFKDLPQLFDGVRYNSLVLDAEDLPDELQPTAWTVDPEDATRQVLMGIQHRDRPLFGTQWHPESVSSTYGQRIVDNFREIVVEFCASGTSTRNSAGHRTPRRASLPDFILQNDTVVREVRQHSHLRDIPTQAPSCDSPYFIESASLGKGVAPQAVFDALIRNVSLDGEAWLDSARVRDAHSRNSYMSTASFTLAYSTASKSLSIYQQGKQIKSEALSTSYWEWLDRFNSDIIRANVEAVQPQHLGQDTEVGQPLLQVGLIGYFGYELKRESLPGYTTSPPLKNRASPDSQHMFSNFVLRLDNYTGEWTAFGLIRRDEDKDPVGDYIDATAPVGLTKPEFNNMLKRIRGLFASPPSPPYTTPSTLPSFVAIDNEDTYTRKIQAAQDAIREGETYEVTLTTRFKAKNPDVDPYSLYLSLRARNPAPYSAYLHFPTSDTAILSSSPERFISIDSEGVAEMKPIKGTLAVSPDKEEDERRKVQLGTDVKELAENLMIVDLIRSDLHNISPSKSIKVPKLLHVESYETVHQLVTTIQSQIARNVGGVKVIERCFPPGSMTGAPKLRSVQIIDALEEEKERGIYSGSLGYICASGTVDQSVVIRTVIKSGGTLELGAGGAITWLSETDKEWDEVLVKANAVATALPKESAHA